METYQSTVIQESELAREAPLQPAIYVASVADYNAGRLHGIWIDPTLPPESSYEEITAMLATSTMPHAEEWMIHDYHDFGVLRLREYEDLDQLQRLAVGLVRHGPALAAWLDLVGREAPLGAFEQAYIGHFVDLPTCQAYLADELEHARQLEQALASEPSASTVNDKESLAQYRWLNGDIACAAASGGGVWAYTSQVG